MLVAVVHRRQHVIEYPLGEVLGKWPLTLTKQVSQIVGAVRHHVVHEAFILEIVFYAHDVAMLKLLHNCTLPIRSLQLHILHFIFFKNFHGSVALINVILHFEHSGLASLGVAQLIDGVPLIKGELLR